MKIIPDSDLGNALRNKRKLQENKSDKSSLKVDMSAIKGNQGKIRLSISLEPDVKSKLQRLAHKNGYSKISTFLNDLIKSIEE